MPSPKAKKSGSFSKKRPPRGRGQEAGPLKKPVRAPKMRAPKKKNAPAARRPDRNAILRVLRRAALHERERKERPHQLARHESNPIIEPIAEHPWESWQTFNPAAIFEDEKVHIVYRAIGSDGISRFGYASSSDGVGIDERLPSPIFTLQTEEPSMPAIFKWYPSGGSWGGAEDPRLTRIGNRVYMFFIALDGNPKLAMTSIALDDFLHHRWKWEKVKIISPPGTVNKSGCALPEKINGKYVIFHRGVSFGNLHVPDIWVDFIDDIDFKSGEVLRGHHVISPRKGYWDSIKIGAGAPPMKTKYGWLLIYYAVGERDPGRYKIGAMLLDMEHPEKVLYRSSEPILEPEEWYENTGNKGGIVYPCGAVVKDGDLYVYYGGADNYVCVAKANLTTFIEDLRASGRPKLTLQKKSRNARR